MDLTRFAEEVGDETFGPVTIEGMATRGGGSLDVRTVRAPSGVSDVQADEMTVRCGAGTPVHELLEALAPHRQTVAIPATGTVGGALACADSDIRRLGYGPVRDTVLQVRAITAAGRIVKAGGPTVKNVSGFDVCRLLVGSRGTLALMADVILRTRPLPAHAQWFVTDEDPVNVLARLYRPSSVLWDGSTTYALLEGHADDVAQQGRGMRPSDAPQVPDGGMMSLPVQRCLDRTLLPSGRFLVEVGVGTVRCDHPIGARPMAPGVSALNERLKREFDPTGRLNP